MKSKTKYPFNITKSDLKYPSWKSHDVVMNHIDLYRTADGWKVCTLEISKSKKFANRTYAIDENGKVWSVGKGPHVLEQITVWVRKSRMKKLQKLIELYESGLTKANTIRDSISSKRARTALRRSMILGRSW